MKNFIPLSLVLKEIEVIGYPDFLCIKLLVKLITQEGSSRGQFHSKVILFYESGLWICILVVVISFHAGLSALRSIIKSTI